MTGEHDVMGRFFTADLHLGHGNIIEYSGRPFRDVAHMSSELVERWNSTVGPTDEVVVLGDFAMGRISETLLTASELNGRKVLLAGNHDRCWHGHKKGVDAPSIGTSRQASTRSGREASTFRSARRESSRLTSRTVGTVTTTTGLSRTGLPTRVPGSSTATFIRAGSCASG